MYRYRGIVSSDVFCVMHTSNYGLSTHRAWPVDLSPFFEIFVCWIWKQPAASIEKIILRPATRHGQASSKRHMDGLSVIVYLSIVIIVYTTAYGNAVLNWKREHSHSLLCYRHSQVKLRYRRETARCSKLLRAYKTFADRRSYLIMNASRSRTSPIR